MEEFTVGKSKAASRQSSGAGTLYGFEGDIQQILDQYKTPQSAIYKNCDTNNSPTLLEFTYSPFHAMTLVQHLSLVGEEQDEAQTLLNLAQDTRVVILGDQENFLLSERETMLAAAFFELGLKAGMTAGLHQDELRKKAKKTKQGQSKAGKNAKNKHYMLHVKEIYKLLDEHITGGKQEACIAAIEAVCGKRPDPKTIRAWRNRRSEGRPLWEQQE
jgi:hypothetical protein